MSKQSQPVKSETKTETKTSRKSKDVITEAVAAVVEAPAATEKKASRKTKESTPAPAAPAVEEASTTVAAGEETSRTKERRQVTRETVEAAFDSLDKLINDEIESIRANDDKNKKGVRFLRTVAKQIRQLKSDTGRISSKRVRRESGPRSTNSGFMKPVKISKDMQKFTGIKEDQLVSRVDVTKSICNYVKANNLQNQADRRQFTPDEKLAKLLGTKEPLTYYNLQSKIQPHFIKA